MGIDWLVHESYGRLQKLKIISCIIHSRIQKSTDIWFIKFP